jgi:translation initiation factor 1
MSATNKTSAEISTSPPSVILSHIVPINISTRSGGGGGGVIHDNNDVDDDDILAQKIMISVHRGKKTITKIEGIPDKFNLVKILKKLKSKDVLSCGGHIAKDKETGKDFIVVQGSYSLEIETFLVQEDITEKRLIIHRG